MRSVGVSVCLVYISVQIYVIEVMEIVNTENMI
jgi:hypothetical protein